MLSMPRNFIGLWRTADFTMKLFINAILTKSNEQNIQSGENIINDSEFEIEYEFSRNCLRAILFVYPELPSTWYFHSFDVSMFVSVTGVLCS